MAIYKHLRSSTANKRPTTSIADGQLAINTNTASPGLFFKDSAGTGIVKVGPVHVGTTAPNVSPAAGGSSGNYTGEQWLDTSVSPNQMKVWNGSAWVGIVADELPVSKLQDGTAGQIVQTDSAGTGVEWSSTTNLPLGSAATPAYSFQGDPNTGIYSPGADQLAISTAGTGRLFVDANGNVGIGVSPSNYAGYNNLVQNGSSGSTFEQRIAGALVGSLTAAGDVSLRSVTAIPITLCTNNTERLRITSDGNVGIGTSSPGSALEVYATAPVLTINSAAANASSIALQQAGTTYARFRFDGTNVDIGNLYVNGATILNAGNAERARIDSSGRLLVGTSTAPTGARSQYSKFSVYLNTQSTAEGSQLNLVGGARGLLSVGDKLGQLIFTDTTDGEYGKIACELDAAPGANDYPGRLVFSTTADGAATPTERMRIKKDGTINFSNVATYADNAAATAGGLAVGDVYRTATGQLMIRY